MKVFVDTDLEGVSGVVSSEEQCRTSGRYYEEARRLLTAEVNATVEGLLEAGAREIVVLDGHGGGGLYFPDLHPEAQAIIGGPLPPIPCLDQSYDAHVMIGRHAIAGTYSGVLDHTQSSATIVNYWLNGQLIGEIGTGAALAGQFGVPTILVTGDEEATREAQALLGDVEVVAVKRGLSRGAALCLAPAKAQQLIREAAARALGRLSEFKPFVMPPPYALKIEFLNSERALQETIRSKNVERIDARTIVCRGDNLLDVLYRR
ncbi:MAG: M55 family metallopeptidase [Ardenticatenaceae bacterium]|nr:M55 family metallopeptidase [Ardenticatenaceae bacterium]